MKQYCRYCLNMICGDSNYCEVRDQCFTDAFIKNPNTCKDFEFCEMDALQENEKPYKQREPKKPVDEDRPGQTRLFEEEKE